jgi:hypothetical protein
LGILDLGIDIVGNNVDELRAEIDKKHLEVQGLLDVGKPTGL